MRKEIKNQLIVSGILAILMALSLIVGYRDYRFHTYVNVTDYQYTLIAQNDEMMIEDYQLYKNQRIAKHGSARIYAKETEFLRKNDKVFLKIMVKDTNGNKYVFDHTVEVKSTDQVCYLDEQNNNSLDNLTFLTGTVSVRIERKGKNVYEQDLTLINQKLFAYNGSNKDYTVHNVYATDNWLKSGDLLINDENLIKNYSSIDVDYLVLKEAGLDNEIIENYDRVIHISGNTEDVLNGKYSDVYFSDTSFEGKTISIVITLKNDSESISVKIDLSKTGV